MVWLDRLEISCEGRYAHMSCHSPSLLSSSCTRGTHRGWSEEGGAEQQPSEPVTSAPYLAGSPEDVIQIIYTTLLIIILSTRSLIASTTMPYCSAIGRDLIPDPHPRLQLHPHKINSHQQVTSIKHRRAWGHCYLGRLPV